MLFQDPRELQARELASLIGVEDIRCAIVGHGLLDRLCIEIGHQCVGQPPRQHAATGPVEDREQIHEAARYRDLGLSRTCAPFQSCDQRFRMPSR